MSAERTDLGVIRAWITHQQYGRGVPPMSEPVAGLFERIAALTTDQQTELWMWLTIPYCTRAVDVKRLLIPLAGKNPSALSLLYSIGRTALGPEAADADDTEDEDPDAQEE